MTTTHTPNYEIAENIAAFYLDNDSPTKSSFGYWEGKLNKAKQLELFGNYFGRGTIMIDWSEETVSHHVTTGFGQDGEFTAKMKWDGEVIFNNRKS